MGKNVIKGEREKEKITLINGVKRLFQGYKIFLSKLKFHFKKVLTLDGSNFSVYLASILS